MNFKYEKIRLLLVGSCFILLLIIFFSNQSLEIPLGSDSKIKDIEKKRIIISKEIIKDHKIEYTQLASIQPAQEIILPGRILKDPTQTAIVSSRSVGRITKILVHESDKVVPNQILAFVQSTQVAQVQTAHLKILLQYNLKKKQLERAKELFENHILALKDLEIAMTEYESILSELNLSRIQLKDFNLSDFEIKQLESKKTHTGELAVKSPIEGIIIESTLALGQSVNTEDVLFTIGKENHIWLVLDVYEKDLPYISLGMSAELIAPGQNENQIRAKAKVVRISQEIDVSTRSSHVWLETVQLEQNIAKQFRFGQTISARIEGVLSNQQGNKLKVLPQEAIHKIEGKNYVFVQVSELEFEAKLVEIGWSSEKWAQIQEGIEPEDKVATVGSFILKSEYLKN